MNKISDNHLSLTQLHYDHLHVTHTSLSTRSSSIPFGDSPVLLVRSIEVLGHLTVSFCELVSVIQNSCKLRYLFWRIKKYLCCPSFAQALKGTGFFLGPNEQIKWFNLRAIKKQKSYVENSHALSLALNKLPIESLF